MGDITSRTSNAPLNIAVVGSGVAGMSAAWLLARKHHVVVYEREDRLGGHANTVEVEEDGRAIPVDTGFIVYNVENYPNLVALFDRLGIATQPTKMSFSASLDDGRFEYSGSGLSGLLAQPRNLFRPRLWSMLRDVLRFYREAQTLPYDTEGANITLGQYLDRPRYRAAFIRDHLLPMSASIWSSPPDEMLDYPLVSFVRFCKNHGLVNLTGRPMWRTVVGGSRDYVDKLTSGYRERVRLNTAVRAVHRNAGEVLVEDRQGGREIFDHVVFATHADQTLGLLADPDPVETRLLGKFRYQRNLAVLHTDSALMPRSRRAWSSWNFMSRGRGADQAVSVSYWMNRLQNLSASRQYFVTLNPLRHPGHGHVRRSFLYDHPIFDSESIRAQRLLWNLQGTRGTWFCGSYFGYGFHEDALQSGLAVAEQLGGTERPWQLVEPNSRIVCYGGAGSADAGMQAA